MEGVINTTKTIVMPKRGDEFLFKASTKGGLFTKAKQEKVNCDDGFLTSYSTANPDIKDKKGKVTKSVSNKDGSTPNPFKSSKADYSPSDLSYQLSDDKKTIQLGYSTNGNFKSFHSFSVEAFKNNPSIGDIEIKDHNRQTIRTMSAVDVLVEFYKKGASLELPEIKRGENNTIHSIGLKVENQPYFYFGGLIFDKFNNQLYLVIKNRNDNSKKGVYDYGKIKHSSTNNEYRITYYSREPGVLPKRLCSIDMRNGGIYNFFKDNNINFKQLNFTLVSPIKMNATESMKYNEDFIDSMYYNYNDVKKIIEAEQKNFVAQYNQIIFDNIPKPQQDGIKLCTKESSLDDLMKQNAELTIVVDKLDNQKAVRDNIKTARNASGLTQEEMQKVFGENGMELFKKHYDELKFKDSENELIEFLNNNPTTLTKAKQDFPDITSLINCNQRNLPQK